MNTDERLELSEALSDIGSDVDVAECHGMLCGMLCGVRMFEPELWLRHVAGNDTVPDPGSTAREALDALAVATAEALEDEAFAFDLALPDDTQPLAERAAAFAGWCRGFLSGFGLSGITDVELLGTDAREFLRDVERFCALDVEAVDNDDDGDDAALTELVEFVRAGVMIVKTDAEALIPASAPIH